MAVLVAIGVDEDGYREMLGVAVGCYNEIVVSRSVCQLLQVVLVKSPASFQSSNNIIEKPDGLNPPQAKIRHLAGRPHGELSRGAKRW